MYARRGKREEGRKLAEQGLLQMRQAEHSDQQIEATTLYYVGFTFYFRSQFLEAKRLGQESLESFSEIGDLWGVSECLKLLGTSDQWGGQLEEAEQHLQASLPICRKIGNLDALASVNENLAWIAIARGEYAQVKRLLDEHIQIKQQFNNQLGLADGLRTLSGLAMGPGRLCIGRTTA
ncbi:tetratricopeptide repeat protein [Chloroflexi bacterium TSY]|nr:tetratricopeptide repeat protein [Chloroflexi bacterium TSY]